MLKKLKQKIRMTSLCVLRFYKVVSRKIDLSCVKKTKFGAKNKAFHNINFVFLHRPLKNLKVLKRKTKPGEVFGFAGYFCLSIFF
jgi:hypothetical protein